jgi:uncharacterized protein YjbI with pentapeptide repeats
VTAIAIIAVGYLPKANSFSGFQGKTLWDWLSLLVVPASLAGLGAWLQLKEQQIAEDNRQEEVLQHYQDRISYLLIEKELLEIAAKDSPTTEETALLKESVKSIQTLTLSTLRRLSDGRHKARVVWLLIEADIIQRGISQKSKVKIDYTDLRGAQLDYTDLSGAQLYHADLSGADLEGADLTDAYLIGADLTRANLMNANLEDAILYRANLMNANLEGADLKEVIGLTKQQIEKAYLCQTKLPEDIDIDPNRDCAKLAEITELDKIDWFKGIDIIDSEQSAEQS